MLEKTSGRASQWFAALLIKATISRAFVSVSTNLIRIIFVGMVAAFWAVRYFADLQV